MSWHFKAFFKSIREKSEVGLSIAYTTKKCAVLWQIPELQIKSYWSNDFKNVLGREFYTGKFTCT